MYYVSFPIRNGSKSTIATLKSDKVNKATVMSALFHFVTSLCMYLHKYFWNPGPFPLHTVTNNVWLIGIIWPNLIFVILTDKPVCGADQKMVYGVAHGEIASINCSVKANPTSGIRFRWTFNSRHVHVLLIQIYLNNILNLSR